MPKATIPATGSRRILQETALFPAYSARFRLVPVGKRPEIYRKHGSSIPAGKILYREPFFSYHFPSPESHRICTVSCRKLTGTPPYSPGNSRKAHVSVRKPTGCTKGYFLDSFFALKIQASERSRTGISFGIFQGF